MTLCSHVETHNNRNNMEGVKTEGSILQYISRYKRNEKLYWSSSS